MTALLAALALFACAQQPAPDLGSRLSAQATSFLQEKLGAGRARAFVVVEAELPGVSPRSGRDPQPLVTERLDQIEGGDLVIKRLRVMLSLDASLPQQQREAAAAQLATFLQLDGGRGDTVETLLVDRSAPAKTSLALLLAVLAPLAAAAVWLWRRKKPAPEPTMDAPAPEPLRPLLPDGTPPLGGWDGGLG